MREWSIYYLPRICIYQQESKELLLFLHQHFLNNSPVESVTGTIESIVGTLDYPLLWLCHNHKFLVFRGYHFYWEDFFKLLTILDFTFFVIPSSNS